MTDADSFKRSHRRSLTPTDGTKGSFVNQTRVHGCGGATIRCTTRARTSPYNVVPCKRRHSTYLGVSSRLSATMAAPTAACHD